MIMKSLYGLCNSKLQQIYAFIYYDFPGHPLLVNYSNAYRPREEHKSSELSIMQTTFDHEGMESDRESKVNIQNMFY